MAPAEFVEVETTVPARFARSTARAFGQGFVARRLAACVNAFAVESSYWWRGRQESAREVLLRFKTTRAASGRLVRALRAEHPYDVPYVAAFALDVRDARYARWLREETRAATPGARARRRQ